MYLKRILIISVIFVIHTYGLAQNNVNGFVKDHKTGENLIGAQIYNINKQKGVLSNNYGYYNISYTAGDTLRFSFIGYETFFLVTPNNVTNFNAKLKSVNVLNVVEVTSELPNHKKNEISTLKIPIKQIKKLPSISGETDVLLAYQLLPGVQQGVEGTSGIFVRGGSPDQNLFILDDIPLYYVNHIGGFVSVFDANAINSMTLYKGGFPAKYGGRISSVVDFRMKEGNNKKINTEIGFGVFASKIFIDGPIKKDTSSFFISLRRSNIDLLTRLTSFAYDGNNFKAGYTFYDINAKYTHKLKNNGKLQFITYLGRDRIFINYNIKDKPTDLHFKSKDEIKWGNKMGQIKYTKAISPKLFNTTTAGITYFKYNTEISTSLTKISTDSVTSTSSLNFLSSVFDIILKSDFEYFANENHKIQFGVEGINHIFKPGVSSSLTTGEVIIGDSLTGSNKLITQETKLFFQDKIKFSPRFFANIGLHYQTYFVQKDVLMSLQPRILLNYNVTENSALRMAYSRMNQNVHLLSNSGTGVPTDLWVPATKNLKPEISDQFTLAFAHTFNKKFEYSIEAYYKQLQNLVDYYDGSSFLYIGDDWEKIVAGNGIGTVKGIELLLKKTQGKLQGWIGYTLSKNIRQFESINNGQEFYYKNDRRHNFSAVGFYDINEKISLSATWVFKTGTPITLAQEKYDILIPGLNWNIQPGQDYIINTVNTAQIYNGKNAYRLPNYHKLDVSISLKKEKPKGLRTWQFGLYNAYNRQNPFFLYYKVVDSEVKLYQLSLFPIIPSVSYTFKFK